MSEDILGYSSHDWRKNTDDAKVIDEKNMTYAKVNDCKVSFKNPRSLKTKWADEESKKQENMPFPEADWQEHGTDKDGQNYK